MKARQAALHTTDPRVSQAMLQLAQNAVRNPKAHSGRGTLALEAERLEPGQRVLCLGVGSGLNTAMLEIEW